MFNNFIIIFLLTNILFIITILYSSYKIKNFQREKNHKNKYSFIEFINKGKIPPLKFLLVGFIFGFIFGFMDNFIIWFFLDKLNKYLPGDMRMKAVLGNTYSDFIGSTLGTFITILIFDYYNVHYNTEDQPLWVNTLSVFCGNIAGILFSKVISIKE